MKTQGEPQGFWIPWRENCAGEAQRDRVIEKSIELDQVGIEQVKECIEELSVD